jgi:hypothetical protein
MTYGMLAWCAIALLGVAMAVLGYDRTILHGRIIKDSGKEQKVISALFTIVFVLFLIVNTNYSSYSLLRDKEDCSAYHLPQIDSTMYVSNIDDKAKTYYTCSTDTVIHQEKSFYYDLYSLDRITDVFCNKKLNHRLEMTFVRKRLFHSEERIYLLKQTVSGNDVAVDSLTESEKDSVLHAWGYDEKLYVADNRY